MKLPRLIVILLLISVLLLPFAALSKESNKEPAPIVSVIRFGTIPVLQSLPLFVAAEKGFFKEHGINAEIILFNSAMEKDVALISGQIDGYFGDFMTPLVIRSNNTEVKIVAENFNTTKKQRMFALLSSPQSKDKTLQEIAKEGIATGSNTIAEYLIIRLLQPHNITGKSINLVDVKNIPIRLQMLLSGQVSAALLPEPLATLAETKGAKVLLDDKNMGISATVFAFSEKFLVEHPHSVNAFHRAVNAASLYINKNPNEVRTIMNRNCKVPEPLQSSFRIPEFPALVIPSPNKVNEVYIWLREKQIIKKSMTYKDIVADGYLP